MKSSVIVMKKKLFNSKKVYAFLQKRRRNIKRRSIILALFVFGVNIFAWFIYIVSDNIDINANVKYWEVKFTNASNEVFNDVSVTFDEKLYPGMNAVSEEIIAINNEGELPAEFEYTINSIKFGDLTFLADEYGNLSTFMDERFPFDFQFNLQNKTVIPNGERRVLTLTIGWPLDSSVGSVRRYFKILDNYVYDPSVFYYRYNGSNYVVASDITSESLFNTAKNNLYIERDDLDTFFGGICGPDVVDCLNFDIYLKATQKN